MRLWNEQQVSFEDRKVSDHGIRSHDRVPWTVLRECLEWRRWEARESETASFYRQCKRTRGWRRVSRSSSSRVIVWKILWVINSRSLGCRFESQSKVRLIFLMTTVLLVSRSTALLQAAFQVLNSCLHCRSSSATGQKLGSHIAVGQNKWSLWCGAPSNWQECLQSWIHDF